VIGKNMLEKSIGAVFCEIVIIWMICLLGVVCAPARAALKRKMTSFDWPMIYHWVKILNLKP